MIGSAISKFEEGKGACRAARARGRCARPRRSTWGRPRIFAPSRTRASTRRESKLCLVTFSRDQDTKQTMRTCALLMLVACTAQPRSTNEPPSPEPELEPDAMPTIVPGPCDQEVSLYGASGSATPTIVGPFTIDSDGADICLELDARDNIVVAHFAASTPHEADQTTSMFQLTLFAKDGAVLQQSWDVTFGTSPPVAFANLEYGVTKGTVLKTTLHVAAKCVPIGMTVELSLFEPYE